MGGTKYLVHWQEYTYDIVLLIKKKHIQLKWQNWTYSLDHSVFKLLFFVCFFILYHYYRTLHFSYCLSRHRSVSRHPGEKIEMFLHGVSSILAMCSNLICFAVRSQLQ